MVKENKLQILGNPPGVAFGGINTFAGFLSDDLRRMLSICSVKYMGAYQFENGRLHETLCRICRHRSPNDFYQRVIRDVNFFIIIDESELEQYCSMIYEWMNSNTTFEYHGLKNVSEGKPGDIKGWIDLDNGVAFFIDEPIARKMEEFLHSE